MTKAELIQRIIKLEDENQALTIKNEELKKQIPCPVDEIRYKNIADRNLKLYEENQILKLVAKQAEFIMRKVN